jgi:hypothetical protein
VFVDEEVEIRRVHVGSCGMESMSVGGDLASCVVSVGLCHVHVELVVTILVP